MNYEYYSSLALVTSVVVYMLAMFAHAAEWASARRVPAEAGRRRARELVSVGVGDGARRRPAPSRRRPPASASARPRGSSSSAGSVWP